VKNTFNARRAYIIASAFLSKNTDEVERLKQALVDRLAGTRIGISPHTPWDEVIATTNDALEKRADCLITIGGGSLVDGAKTMLLFMANNITTVSGVLEFAPTLKYSQQTMRKSSADIGCTPPNIPLISIPTTLSGGEYTSFGGGTDPETHFKLVMGHPRCGPALIINDPKLTITAPEWVWLSTGVRAIDHCCELYCRTHAPDQECDEAALEGFKLIVPNLLITKKDWTNEEARLKCTFGVNKVMIMLKRGVLGGGASHGSEFSTPKALHISRFSLPSMRSRTSAGTPGCWPRTDILHLVTERDEI
jgi:alcohol dehydrogenase class IV